MAGQLDGKIAFITGGCSGIGLAMVETFIAEGARIVVGDLQEDKGTDLVRRFPEVLRFARCDVSSEEDVSAAIALAVSAFGGLDITCNNAGIGGPQETVENISVENWDRGLAILLRGPLLGIKHSIPAMRARGGGSIINTASAAAVQSGLAAVTYGVAKAGVVQLSRKAAAECAHDRIRVNTLCPGFIATSIFGNSRGLPRGIPEVMAQEMDHAFKSLQPLPYAGLPKDIADAALYLASASARFVTGTEILIDGGLLLKPGLDVKSVAPGSLLAMVESARQKAMGDA
jgi:NAD(P)-dependent dehydrogenase (short-subunit alcohol dehydrogenase family)